MSSTSKSTGLQSTQNKNDISNCSYCDKKADKKPSVQCEGCKLWVHSSCFGLKGEWLEKYQEIQKSGGSFPFKIICQICIKHLRDINKVKSDLKEVQHSVSEIEEK